jgi:hypothetical protein
MSDKISLVNFPKLIVFRITVKGFLLSKMTGPGCPNGKFLPTVL